MKNVRSLFQVSRLGVLMAVMAVSGFIALMSTPKASALTCTAYIYRQGGTGTCVKYIQIMLNDLAVGS